MSVESARYRGEGDRFLAFWLLLVVDSRDGATTAGVRRVRATVDGFRREMADALSDAGDEPYFAGLLDAAERYFGTTLTDPTYATSMFGLKRLSTEQLHGKIADQAAKVAGMLAGLREDFPRRLTQVWLQGYSNAVPQGRDALARALSTFPEAAGLMPD